MYRQILKSSYRSSQCGKKDSVASLQSQDAGSMPGPAQWVKGLHCHRGELSHNCGLDLSLGPGIPYAIGQPKKKKRRRKKAHLTQNKFSGHSVTMLKNNNKNITGKSSDI